jgi:hypothetical protein
MARATKGDKFALVGIAVVGVAVLVYYWWTSREQQGTGKAGAVAAGGATAPPSTQTADGPLSGFLDPIFNWFEGSGLNDTLQQQAGEVGQHAEEAGEGWVQEAGTTITNVLNNLMTAPDVATS